MIRMLFVFLLTFVLITGLQIGWNMLTKSEKWQCTKILFRGIILSMVTVIVLTTIVILF